MGKHAAGAREQDAVNPAHSSENPDANQSDTSSRGRHAQTAKQDVAPLEREDAFEQTDDFEQADIFEQEDTSNQESIFEQTDAFEQEGVQTSFMPSQNLIRVRHKCRRKPVKKIVLGVLIAVLVLVGGTAAYAMWYTKAINEALSMDTEEEAAALDEVTTDVASGEPFYVLIMGSDLRESSSIVESESNASGSGRSDVMILLRVDTQNKKLTMVSVPRDTPYTYPDGTVKKLNETYNIGGAAMTVQAVEEITGVNISHYIELRFSDFEAMVDTLGGITVNVEIPVTYQDALTGEWIEIDKGEQKLNGQQAQVYVRARHEYDTEQDMHRQSKVRDMVTSMLKAVLDRPLYEIPNTVLDLAQYIRTDMKADDLLYLVQTFASGDLTLYSCTGPNLGDINDDAGGIWLCYENPEGWAKLMAAVDAGEDPSGIDVNATAIKPDDASQSQTEGTSEPEKDDEGNYIVNGQAIINEDGGYVQSDGVYYYNDYAEKMNSTD